MRKHAPVKIIEAPVRAYIPTSLPPGSIHGGPSIAGSGKLFVYVFKKVDCLYFLLIFFIRWKSVI